jgi:hypothetical protein
LLAGGNHFFADAITRNGCDAVCLHVSAYALRQGLSPTCMGRNSSQGYGVVKSDRSLVESCYSMSFS